MLTKDTKREMSSLRWSIKKERTMTKENFLTVRWNNLLTLALGIPALIYVVVAFSTSLWSTRAGLIGLAIIGVLY